MVLIRPVLICCLILLAAGDVWSQQRAVLTIRDLRQWIGLSYRYVGQTNDNKTGSSNTSTENRFRQWIHFQNRYAVWHRGLLNGHFSVDLGMEEVLYDDEIFGSGTNVDPRMEYALDGVFAEHRTVPVNFYSRASTRTVSRLYARSYDLDRYDNGVQAFWRNSHVPVTLGYTSNYSRTRGLDNDSREWVDAVRFSARHAYRNISRSRFNVSYAHDKTEAELSSGDYSNDIFQSDFGNYLSFENLEKPLFLDSFITYRSYAGDSSYSAASWTENMEWRPGRALTTGIDYLYNYRDSEIFDTTENQERWWLRHRLFQNLTTNMEVYASQFDFTTGEEDNVAGGIRLDYQKRLPALSDLNLGFGFRYGIVDRQVDENVLQIMDEKVSVSQYGTALLSNPNVLPDTVTVLNEQRGKIYVEGLDYILNSLGRFTEIEILSGSEIAPGDILSVDYRIRVNPSIKYSNTGFRGSGAVSLFSRLHRFYASYANTSQDLIAGSDSDVRLIDLNTYTVGYELRLIHSSYGIEYINYDSTIDKYQSAEAYWRYRRQFRMSTAALQVRDIYTYFSEPESHTGNLSLGGQNVVSVNASYRRMLFRRTFYRFMATYLNLQGRSRSRDNVKLSFNFQMKVGKLELFLTSELNWENYEDNTYRQDYVRLEIRRYF